MSKLPTSVSSVQTRHGKVHITKRTIRKGYSSVTVFKDGYDVEFYCHASKCDRYWNVQYNNAEGIVQTITGIKELTSLAKVAKLAVIELTTRLDALDL